MNKLKEKAKFKWRSILSNFLDDKQLDGNHRPCPICGGKDRFRFDDRDGHGSYFCSNSDCGPGSGLHLLAQTQGISHSEAWRLVEGKIGSATNVVPKAEVDRVERVKNLLSICRPVSPGGDVETYLRGRGITCTIPDGLMEAPGKNGTTLMVGRFAHGSKLRGLHVTFLKDGKKIVDGTAKKMYGIERGMLNGSAVRLNALGTGSRLIVTEGIETGMACLQMYGLPVWATGSAHLMEVLEIPPQVTEVLIFGDTDLSFTGQASAYILAKRLWSQKKRVIVELPTPDVERDWDWLDHLNNA